MRISVAGPTAALAGVPSGLQAQGAWSGRRQLFVRFAAEAETATMYTADALAAELRRALERSSFHSIAISGRDPLSNVEYIRAAFAKASPRLPVMLDCDGQRPAEIAELREVLTLAQITVSGSAVDTLVDRAAEGLQVAAKCDLQHALVIESDERTSDAQLLRLIERAHASSNAATVVVHPSVGVQVDRDRRWVTLFERASALHGDVRLALKLPPPTGVR